MGIDKNVSLLNSKYIEIDGVDGVGKSTQADLLKLFLNTIGEKAHVVKEVDDYDDFSSSVRNILFKGNLDPKTEMFLFLSLKAHCFDRRVFENLQNNEIVISDRGNPSFLTYNYNVLKEGSLGNDLLDFIYPTYKPNISLILDAPPAEIAKRIKSKKKKSRFDENLGALIKQQELLKEMSKDNTQWQIIDGEGSIQDVHERIKKAILKIL